MLRHLIKNWLLRGYRNRYRVGAIVRKIIAIDICREIEVIDATDIDDGFLVARCRTWNLLHAARGIEPKPDFGEPKRVEIKTLWDCNGQEGGGRVA